MDKYRVINTHRTEANPDGFCNVAYIVLPDRLEDTPRDVVEKYFHIIQPILSEKIFQEVYRVTEYGDPGELTQCVRLMYKLTGDEIDSEGKENDFLVCLGNFFQVPDMGKYCEDFVYGVVIYGWNPHIGTLLLASKLSSIADIAPLFTGTLGEELVDELSVVPCDFFYDEVTTAATLFNLLTARMLIEKGLDPQKTLYPRFTASPRETSDCTSLLPK